MNNETVRATAVVRSKNLFYGLDVEIRRLDGAQDKVIITEIRAMNDT